MADETIEEQLGNIGKGADNAKQAFQDTRREVSDIRVQLAGINALTQETNDLFRDLAREMNQGARNSDALAKAVERVKNGSASTNQLRRQAADQIAKQVSLSSKAAQLADKASQATNRQEKAYLEGAARRAGIAADAAGELAAGFEAAARANAELDSNAQFFDRMSKLTAQIPGLGKLSGTFTEAAAAIRKANLQGLEGVAKLNEGFKVLTSVAMAEFVRQLLVSNQQVTDFQRNLNISREKAVELRKEFSKIAARTSDIAINSVRLAEANSELNTQLGTAAVFSEDILIKFSKLTKVAGLSNEAVGGLAQAAMLSGESLEVIEKAALGASQSFQQTTGIALANKEILEKTGRVTGMIRANLGANPALIAEAVAQATTLGSTLEDLSRAGRSLLEFEQSISAELEAELLTGKQLNLERARLAALQGDELTLQKELAANFGTFTEFMDMNVLQREKLAASMGMQADAMADMLFKQQVMGRTAAELRAVGEDELANRVEAMSAQEKMAAATEKFQAALGSLAVAMTPIVDFFASILASTTAVHTLLGAIIPMMAVMAAKSAINFTKSVGTAVAKIFGGNAAMGPLGLGLSLAAVGAMMALIASTTAQTADDARIDGYGNRVLFEKGKQPLAFNNGDTIAASTAGSPSAPGIDYNRMAAAISRVNVVSKHDPWSARGYNGHRNVAEGTPTDNIF